MAARRHDTDIAPTHPHWGGFSAGAYPSRLAATERTLRTDTRFVFTKIDDLSMDAIDGSMRDRSPDPDRSACDREMLR